VYEDPATGAAAAALAGYLRAMLGAANVPKKNVRRLAEQSSPRAYPFAAGTGGTGRMISEATFQSFPTRSQLMIIKNGLAVPSCPAYETVMFIGT
jgi:Phenazine biosynthesis-like protein